MSGRCDYCGAVGIDMSCTDCADASGCDAAEAQAEIKRLRDALRAISEWDMLNPPASAICSDLPWLKALVESALAGSGGGE